MWSKSESVVDSLMGVGATMKDKYILDSMFSISSTTENMLAVVK